MRRLMLLVLISALAFPAWAEECEKLAGRYAESSEEISYLNVSRGNDGEYLLFSIGGKYSMLARCGPESVFLTDVEDIEALLDQYARASGQTGSIVPDATWTKNMESLLDKFAGSRGKEEECKRYIGIDRTPCSDRASCIKSCYTPMCSELKQSNECKADSKGCDFIDSIVFFANNLTVLDNGTTRVKSLVKSISGVSSTGPLDEAISALEGMLASTEMINKNNLMQEKIYYFCPRVSYDRDALEQMRDELKSLRNKYSLLITPAVTAKFVSTESTRRVELRKNIDRCAESMNYSKASVAGITGSPHPAANYSEVTEPLGKMKTISNQLSSLCSARKFGEAGGAMNSFLKEEKRANAALANVSAGYDSVKSLYSQVLSEIMALPPEVNTSKLSESMEMVQRELAVVNTASDLAVLKGVLLENQKHVQELAKPKQSLLEQAGIPLGIAVAITVVLYFLMRKTKRRGL